MIIAVIAVTGWLGAKMVKATAPLQVVVQL